MKHLRTTRRVLILVAVLALSSPIASFAQVPPQQPSEPATRFEKVLLTKSSLGVREYYTLGTISGRYGGDAAFEVARTYVPGSANHAMALRVQIKEAGRLERQQIGVLDREEVVSLATALPQMEKMADTLKQTQSATQDGGSTEIVFSGGSLRFTAFVGRQRGDGLAIQAGVIGSTQVFLELSDLTRVEMLVSRAVAKMQVLDQKR